MKTVYDTVRAILYRKDCSGKVGNAVPWVWSSFSQELYQALRNFELHNRGHQDLLSSPKLDNIDPYETWTRDPSSRNLELIAGKRRYHAYLLINTILRLPELPTTTEFDALLQNPALGLECQQWSLIWLPHGLVGWQVPSRLHLHTVQCFEENQKWLAEIRVSNSALKQASRRCEIFSPTARNLKEAHAAFAQDRKNIQELINQSPEWLKSTVPEKPPGLPTIAGPGTPTVAHVKATLAQALKEYSPEVQGLIRQNWNKVCP